MATVVLDEINKVYDNGFQAIHDLESGHRRQRVLGAGRSVGVWEVDGVADDRRVGDDHGGDDEDR